jgi:hypothetical protein
MLYVIPDRLLKVALNTNKTGDQVLYYISHIFPYWPVYHPSTHIGPRLRPVPIWGSRDENKANMEMPMY